jgi:hypothetical protein
MCKVCVKIGSAEKKGCNNPLPLEVTKNERKSESRSERLRKRRHAIGVLERELKAAYLFTSPWSSVHSTRYRGEALSQGIGGKISSGETKSSRGENDSLSPKNKSFTDKLKQSLLDTRDLKQSLIEKI